MPSRRRNWRRWLKIGVVAAVFVCGCATSQRAAIGPAVSDAVRQNAQPGDAHIVQAAAVESASIPAGPLTLDILLELAAAHHPDLSAAHARVESARGKLIQAGLYPNPTVGWEADELGHNGNGAGEQGPFFSQHIVTGGKLELAQAAAAQGVAVADWQALTTWYKVATAVRMAYYELLVARLEVQENERLARIAEESVEVARKLLAATGSRIDELRAQIELEETRGVKLASARERERTAWRLLSAAVGVPLEPGPIEGNLDAPVRVYEWKAALQATLTRSSEIQEAQAELLQMRQDVERAYAEVVPNLELKVRPFYAFPDKDQRLMVEAGLSLPLFNRNEGNIMAAQAEVARAAARVRQVEVSLQDRLAAAFQRYLTARLQVESYQKQILPKAEQTLELIRKSWEKNDPKFDYNSVLLAQRTLTEAQLAYVRALGELWRAAAEIGGLLQEPIGKTAQPGPKPIP